MLNYQLVWLIDGPLLCFDKFSLVFAKDPTSNILREDNLATFTREIF